MTSEIWKEQDKLCFGLETSGWPQKWCSFPDAGGGVQGSTEHQGQFKLRCLRNSSYIVKYGWGKNPPSIHSKTYTPFIFYHWPFPFPHIKKLSHSFQKEGQDFKISGFSFSNRLAGDTFKTHTHKTCTHTYPTHTDPTHTYDNNQYKYDLCKLVLSIKGIQNVCNSEPRDKRTPETRSQKIRLSHSKHSVISTIQC